MNSNNPIDIEGWHLVGFISLSLSLSLSLSRCPAEEQYGPVRYPVTAQNQNQAKWKQ